MYTFLREYVNLILDKCIKENLLNKKEIMNKNINVFIDLDGVCADFDNSIKSQMETQQNLKSLANEYQKFLLSMPEFQNLSSDEIKEKLRGEQKEPKLKAFKKIFNKYRDIKFAIANREGFFRNLPVMPDAIWMLEKIYELTGKRPSILTGPMTENPFCEKEKEEWCKEHLSGLYDNFYCTQDKWKYASPNSILIDDRTKYTNSFKTAGGIIILHKNPQQTIEKLKEILNNNESNF